MWGDDRRVEKMTRLKENYTKEILPELKKKLGYENPYCVPRLEKIVINMGIGQAVQDPKMLDEAQAHLAAITGQKPAITRARKAISSFKLRKGKPIGCRVTLRRDRMYEFFDRLVNIAIPRTRDFRGLSSESFDRFGHYTLGVKEQVIFPEILPDKIKHVFGMDITICIKSKKPEDSRELLAAFGMPFKKA
jgi:large subunit ribosomal protein L5